MQLTLPLRINDELPVQLVMRKMMSMTTIFFVGAAVYLINAIEPNTVIYGRMQNLSFWGEVSLQQSGIEWVKVVMLGERIEKEHNNKWERTEGISQKDSQPIPILFVFRSNPEIDVLYELSSMRPGR